MHSVQRQNLKRQSRDVMNLDFTGFFITLVVFGAIIGAILAWGIPGIWSFIKPWIHMWTA